MLPNAFASSSTQPPLFGPLNQYPDLPGGFSHSLSSQPLLDGPLSGPDMNSSELFKQNVHLVLQQLARIEVLARSVISGIENAYRPGTSPTQTSSDLAALKQNIQLLIDILKQSGVGALPVLSPNSQEENLPTEQQLMANTKAAVQQLFDRYKQLQENSAVVASLLNAPEHFGRR